MNEDILKFIDCFFVLLVKNEKVHYTSSFESLIVPQIKQEWKDGWKRYLSKQFEKYEDDYDGYDQWFDELTFDTIPEKVLKQYDLPSEPIIIHIGNEEYLMKNIYRIFNDFIDSIKSYCTPETGINGVAYYNLGGIGCSIWSRKPSTKQTAKIERKVKDMFSDVKTTAIGYFDAFNNMQEKNEIHFKYNTHNSTKAFDDNKATGYQKGGFIDNSVWEYVFTFDNHNVNVFYPNKNDVPKEYTEKLFSILPDEDNYANPEME